MRVDEGEYVCPALDIKAERYPGTDDKANIVSV